MTVSVRRAGVLDTRDMAALLNRIIARGDTTAMTDPVSAADLARWMQSAPDRSAWHLAEDASGRILGFQWIEPHEGLPPDTCDVATYVDIGTQGIGVGSALFDASEKAALALGYGFIAAVIRVDNTGGLAYYQSRGFEDWRMWEDAPVAPRVMKRYRL